MRKDTALALRDVIDLDDEVNVLADYSGRGMHGSETYALVIDHETIVTAGCVQLAYEIGADMVEDRLDAIMDDLRSGFRTDNLGHQIVVY